MREIFIAVRAIMKQLLARRSVRIVLVSIGVVLLAIILVWQGIPKRPPDESLSSEETKVLYAAMRKHVREGGPNHLHMRRLYFYAPPFARARGANVDAVRAAALLHDATKEDGQGAPKERFCTHGEQGASLARELLGTLHKTPRFVEMVSSAVREHMGPCGFNPQWFDLRFMSKFCRRTFPRPLSAEAEVLYDIDMLDLMTVDGIVKVAELRQTNPEFGKEPLEASVKSGRDSAWKSVIDARQTLLTTAARQCGDSLVAHTKAFVDGIDFSVVTTVPALKNAASEYLSKHPFPACLPAVPPWSGGDLP